MARLLLVILGEKIKNFGFQLGTAHESYLGQYILFVWEGNVLALLASFRGSPSFIVLDLCMFFELLLVLLELPLETKIGQHSRPTFTNKGYGLFEAPVVFSHYVGYNKC